MRTVTPNEPIFLDELRRLAVERFGDMVKAVVDVQRRISYSFVARVADGAYEIAPTPAALAIAFNDPFTEWEFVDGGSFLPSWPVIAVNPVNEIDVRTFWFFKNFDRSLRANIRETVPSLRLR